MVGMIQPSLFELTCTISSKLSFILGPRCELDHSLFLIRTARSPSMAATGQDVCEMAGVLPDAARAFASLKDEDIARGMQQNRIALRTFAART